MKKIAFLIAAIFCANVTSCILTPSVHAEGDASCHESKQEIQHVCCDEAVYMRAEDTEKETQKIFQYICIPTTQEKLVSVLFTDKVKDRLYSVFIERVPISIKSTVIIV